MEIFVRLNKSINSILGLPICISVMESENWKNGENSGEIGKN
jgi:hypothetical protein